MTGAARGQGRADALMAIIGDDEVIALDQPVHDPRQVVAGPPDHRPGTRRAPEVRQRAMEMHDKITQLISRYLAQASGHAGDPLPEHDAAARLLVITAGLAPLLGQPGTLAALLAEGLRATGSEPPS